MTTLSQAAQNAAVDAIADLVDDAATAGEIRIYNAGFAGLLAVLTLSRPAFGPAVGGVADAAAITPGTVISTGDPAVFRLVDGDGAVTLSGTVGAPDSGSDLEFPALAMSPTWVAGDSVQLDIYEITIPASD